MEKTKIISKKFNAKKPGALVGTITEVSEYLRLLYSLMEKNTYKNGSLASQHILHYSRNGDCSVCYGTGIIIGDIDPSRMIAPELSIKDGALLLWAGTNCRPVSMIKKLAEMVRIDFEVPLVMQDKRYTDILLYGYDNEPISYVHKNKQYKDYYRGSVYNLQYMRDAGTTSKGNLRAIYFFSQQAKCPSCNDYDLIPQNEPTKINGQSLLETSDMPLSEVLLFIQNLHLLQHDKEYHELLSEITLRLNYLKKIGLNVLPSLRMNPNSTQIRINYLLE